MPGDVGYRLSKSMEKQLQLRMNALAERPGMTRENPEYMALASELENAGQAIDAYEAENRVTDEQGQLLKPPATRTPAMFQPEDQKEYKWYFEPTVDEAKAALKRDPALLQRLDPMGDYSHVVSRAPKTNQFGGFGGSDPTTSDESATTWLDHLTEDNGLYQAYAEDAWKNRLEKARSRYEGIRRYKDVPLEGNEWSVLSGGIKKGARNIVAPAMLGRANAMTMGQASPMYDAARDFLDYRATRATPEGQEMLKLYGLGPDDTEELPRSEDVVNRGPTANLVGNLGGYASRVNPSNLLQKSVSNAMGYEGADAAGRLLAAGVAGGVSNATESVVGDMARYANEGESVPVGDMAKSIGINGILSGAAGFATAGAFDALGQGIQQGREGYVGLNRNAPLLTIERGGGSADVVRGAVPPPEVAAAFERNRKNRYDPTKAPTTAAGDLSSPLAAEMERSVRTRAVNEQDAIGKQMSDYYSHPDYRDIHGTTKPALEGLIKHASEGMGRSRTTGSSVPVNLPELKRISNVLREFADTPEVVSNKVAPQLAYDSGAIVVPAELANHLFAGVLEPLGPGQSALLQPIEINAQALTRMEQRIYDELNMSGNRGVNDDPVWKTVMEGIHEARDQFPLYRDEAGNLASIPPDSVRNEPFPKDPSAIPQTDEMRVLNPPEQVTGGPQRRPQGLFAIDDKEQILPDGPFDQRLGKQQPSGGVDVRRPVNVASDEGVRRPPGLEGVGPGHNPIPENLFDPLLPTSQEAIRPLTMQNVTGGEYGPPPPMDPKARMGVGDRFNPPDVGRRLEPSVTQQVQGSYNRPPEVQMEPAPKTDRNPYGFADRGQPSPETPLPPSNRPQQGNLASAIEASIDNNGLALVPDVVKAFGGDVKQAHKAILDAEARGAIELRPEGGLNRLSPEEMQLTIPGPEGMKLSNIRVIDESLLREKSLLEGNKLAMKEEPSGPTGADGAQGVPTDDGRGGLERMLDAQLEKAPKVPQREIDEIGALQTADREQVARDQKAYVEDLFSPGSEARAREVAKVESLVKDQRVIEEAMGQIQDIDKRLGPLTPEEKGQYLADIVSQKTGQKVTIEDLVRLGIMSAGLLQMATSDDEDGGAAGAAIFGFGFGRGKKATPEVEYGPAKPKKPTQPEFKLENGRTVKGFSAMRAQQHEGQTAIEDAMRRLGVEGDATLEGRIRTYGQLEDRGKIDQALLNEATAMGKEKELRQAAAANAYAELKDRAWFGDVKGFGNKLIDFIGYRTYRALEYPAGRFTREYERNPFAGQPDSTLGRMMRAHVQEPARRLFNLTEGGPASRAAADQAAGYLKGKFFPDDDEERRRQSPSP